MWFTIGFIILAGMSLFGLITHAPAEMCDVYTAAMVVVLMNKEE